jgi:hypothetical protein
MLLHRASLIALTALIVGGVDAPSFADCGTCGPSAPIVYAQPVQQPPFAPGGCGRCGFAPYPPSIAYAPPAPPALMPAPVPVASAPIAVDHWDTGGYGACGGLGGLLGGFGGCNGCGCRGAAAYAPSPLYVVNQGPQYSGPGLMVPYRTYSPAAALTPAINYPYVGLRYGYRWRGYYGPRFAYHRRYSHPRPYGYR